MWKLWTERQRCRKNSPKKATEVQNCQNHRPHCWKVLLRHSFTEESSQMPWIQNIVYFKTSLTGKVPPNSTLLQVQVKMVPKKAEAPSNSSFLVHSQLKRGKRPTLRQLPIIRGKIQLWGCQMQCKGSQSLLKDLQQTKLYFLRTATPPPTYEEHIEYKAFSQEALI